jgi:hypothetical protein
MSKMIGKVSATMVYERKVADIETMLRCEIWGTDGQVFRPERHHQSTIIPEQAEALSLVFGQGPLRCAAAAWSPMAAAIISGAIMAHLERERYKLEPGQCIGGREGWNGWKVRSDSRIVSGSLIK